jgi:hypothetical protein
MKLSPEQYKKFKRFNNFLISEDDPKLEWENYIYDYGSDMDSPYGPYSRGREVDGLQNFREEVRVLEDILETELQELDFDSHMGCENCTGNGTITITYDVETMSIDFQMSVETMETHEHTTEESFDTISKKEGSTWTTYKNLKLLGDQEFIDEMKNKYGEEITVEYDGGGDSGYIREDGIPSILEDITYEILDAYHSGWEINEGSKGNIIYDFKNQRVMINHDMFENDGFNVGLGEIKLTQ